MYIYIYLFIGIVIDAGLIDCNYQCGNVAGLIRAVHLHDGGGRGGARGVGRKGGNPSLNLAWKFWNG